ncbi:MAG: hypothetical protein ACJ74Z_04875, partial [Bryobacteraceae bacterium]
RLGAAQRLGRQHEAATIARQAEITLLRTELDAAREIGKVALASLRTPAAILPPQRSAGRIKLMPQGFGGPLKYSSPLPR